MSVLSEPGARASGGDQAEPRLSVAVVGGGVAGIAAAHALQDTHDVTLFEANDRLGGHAHAISVPAEDGKGGTVEVDTAFLIYNALYYPNFVSFIRELGVEGSTQAAEMSASFVDYDRDLHYTLARGIAPLFAQARNLVRPGFYRLFVELLAFRRRAYRDLLEENLGPTLTLDEYLRPYSELFRACFVVPLASAIWSLPPGLILSYPAKPILEFFRNHHLLKGSSGDAWRTFVGGSGVYIRAFVDHFSGNVRLNEPIERITRSDEGILLVTKSGAKERFDRVVLATHADVSLRLLADPSDEERAALGPWTYHPNTVVLHTDPRFVAKDRKLWASWNVVTRGGEQLVTYSLNRVQSLGKLGVTPDYFLTLGAVDIDPGREVARFEYRHPIFTAASVATQGALARLNGARGTYFCGSYTGHGFHEDAVTSALRVASAFAARR